MTKRTKPKTKADPFSKLIRIIWLSLLAGVCLFFFLFIIISLSKMPDTKELENPSYEYSTIVYSEDMQELGRYFKKNRDWATYDELSPHVINALISAEDVRYFTHSGIDARGTIRMVAFMGKRGGASTITQQLAKNFFTRRSSNIFIRIWQKMQEWAIAIEFEKRYTKEEILAMYLNKYDFLNDANGISAASKTYFGKDHDQLKIEEAATLVGMLKNSRFYNPKLYPENAIKRREIVLSQMKKYNHLSQREYDSLRVLPLDLSNFKRSSHNTGPAPYFRGELTKWLKELLNERRYSKPGGGKYDIYQDGLKVYTTINMRMQKHAESAMQKHMSKIQSRYFKVWKNRDPWTYNADKGQKSIRLNSLKRLIEESDRYKQLRRTFLGKLTSEISKNIENVRLWDADIKRMMEESENPGHLQKLVKRKTISKRQQGTYKEIMESSYWSALNDQWAALQNAAKEVFSRKTRMKVFAYTNSGEKDTIMSPLDSIKYHRMHMQLGSLSIEPSTGHVKTWVGGIGYKYFKYDHIKSNRQVGSTFKPFVYTTAILQAHSPCWKIRDTQYSIVAGDSNFGLLETWAPKNSNGEFSNEDFTLYDCLKLSLNSASIWLMKEIGSVDAVRDVAANMGIPKEKIPNAPAIGLGAVDLSVIDMSAAYSTFANNGIYSEPVFVTRIEDNEGRTIYSAVPKQKIALPSNYNYVMVDMLKYASSTVHWQLDSEFGGKTGTTDDHVDGWFMGISPNLVVGTWVGGEDPWIRFLSLSDGQGGVMARPYFLEYMKRLEADQEVNLDTESSFYFPEGELGVEIDCEYYEQLYQKDKSNKESEFEEQFENNR